MYVDRIDNQLLDAVLRLARLLDTPKDHRHAGAIDQPGKFSYRLLRGPQGYRLYEIAVANSREPSGEPGDQMAQWQLRTTASH